LSVVNVVMDKNYYFDPHLKALICKYCGRGYQEYQSLNDHMRKMHFQKISSEKVI